MSDRKILIIAMLVVVVLLVGGGTAFQAWRTGRDPKAVATTVYTLPPITITEGQPIRVGADSAPAVVTLYEDFHCPHCADFEDELGPTLVAAQQRGEVRVELYPMSFIDEGSGRAANAMACAAEAGFGGGYYGALFANHTLQWSDAQLLELAGVVNGSTTPEFSTCVTTRAHQDWVDSVNAAAGRSGVQGTPTMFLDAAPVAVAGLTPETLEAMISDAAK